MRCKYPTEGSTILNLFLIKPREHVDIYRYNSLILLALIFFIQMETTFSHLNLIIFKHEQMRFEVFIPNFKYKICRHMKYLIRVNTFSQNML
jgi:hypothetical protein